MRVFHRWAQSEEERDNLLVSVYGRGLHAPLIERLLELPFDIHSGTVDGELHVAANDDATWDFPAITGKLDCKGEDEGKMRGGRGGCPESTCPQACVYMGCAAAIDCFCLMRCARSQSVCCLLHTSPLSCPHNDTHHTYSLHHTTTPSPTTRC